MVEEYRGPVVKCKITLRVNGDFLSFVIEESKENINGRAYDRNQVGHNRLIGLYRSNI